MEVYFKDLISEEASLERLVDDLLVVVQSADESAAPAGALLHPRKKEEILSRLQRLKSECRRVAKQTVTTARATDRLLRQYPYVSAGFAFTIGLLAGALLGRRRR